MAVAETPDSLLSGNDRAHKQAAIKLGWKEGNIHRNTPGCMRVQPLQCRMSRWWKAKCRSNTSSQNSEGWGDNSNRRRDYPHQTGQAKGLCKNDAGTVVGEINVSG